MGRKAVLIVSEKKEVLAQREQFPASSQQNIANYSSVLWEKSVSHLSIGDVLSEKNKW